MPVGDAEIQARLPSQQTSVLAAEKFRKSYRKRAVVDNVSLDIHGTKCGTPGGLAPMARVRPRCFIWRRIGAASRRAKFSWTKTSHGCRCTCERATGHKLSATGGVGISKADRRRKYSARASERCRSARPSASTDSKCYSANSTSRTCVTPRRISLSGGERRRTEIAQVPGDRARDSFCWTSRSPESIRLR